MLECELDTAPRERVKSDGFFWLDCAKLKGGLVLRGRRTGDELALPGRPARSLKKILIDRRLPRRLRDGLPLLADGTGVLLAAGLGPDARRLAPPGAAAVKVRFLRRTQEKEIQNERKNYDA